MLQKLIFKWLFRLKIKKNRIQVEGFKDIKNIVIINNLDEKKTCDLEALTYSFQKLGKKVESIGVSLSSRSNEDTKVVSKKDFSFFGKSKTPWIREFLNKKPDYVILIDRSNNYLINHLAIQCEANCYIGYKSIPQNELLTLQIAPLLENEQEVFLRYIKLIEGSYE
ncbi:MAG: hypothetical protein CMB82_03105 [Flammeovirgaceae bacterium]|nr:hypothetical protein [Flammeovirgaceae bacterium]